MKSVTVLSACLFSVAALAVGEQVKTPSVRVDGGVSAIPEKAGLCLSLVSPWWRLGVSPETGGVRLNIADRKTGAEACCRQQVAALPVDGRLLTNRRTGKKTIWVGIPDLNDRLSWSEGLSLPDDRAVLRVENLFANHGPSAERLPDWTNVFAVCGENASGRFRLVEMTSACATNADETTSFVVCWTDGQPDACPVDPGTTVRSVQYWYPVKGLGVVKNATVDGAVNLERRGTNEVFMGFHSTRALESCTVRLLGVGGSVVFEEKGVAVDPRAPWRQVVKLEGDAAGTNQVFAMTIADASGTVFLSSTPKAQNVRDGARTAAVAQGREDAALARLACQKGDWKEALVRVNRAIARSPDEARLYAMKAYVLRRLQRFQEASKTLRRAAALDPLDAWNVIERVFLDDDGEDAVSTVCRDRADAVRTLRVVIGVYRSLGAQEEIAEIRRQAKACGIPVPEASADKENR